jgi:HK97 family phage major capsid protein
VCALKEQTAMAASPEVGQMVRTLNAEWHQFKQENDRRLKAIEASGGRTDPLTEEKVNKHSAAIGDLQAKLDGLVKQLENRVDELQKVMQHKGGAGAGHEDEKQRAHKEGFFGYLRRGKTDGLAQLQAAVSLGDDTHGGYFVPQTIDKEIEQFERDNTPMRQLCRTISVSNEGYEKIVNQGGSSSGWVDEEEARPETTTPTLAALKPYFGEIYANPALTQKSLDDPQMDLAAWLSEEVGLEFAEQENDAFTRGSGVKKPKGILSYTLSTSVDGTRSFGQIQKVHSGSSGAFVADKLIDLVYSLKRGYRMNARWMFSALALGAIRKLKDGQNNYLFQPSYVAGQPQMLLGYPIEENDDVPDPAADANAALFGDFRRAYIIVDVRGVRVLRDEYTNKPKVHFYSTKRVGGFLANDRAVKVYTLST